MRHQLGAVTFRSQPEAALAVLRDPFEIQFLSGLTIAGNACHTGDLGRLLRHVDRIDRRLHGIEAVAHRIDDIVLRGIPDHARQCAPAQRLAMTSFERIVG